MKITTADDNPFSHGTSIIDTRGAVLLEHTEVVQLDEPSSGRTLVALELEGRVNRSSARSDVLYLMDADGAAALVTEVIGLFTRADPALAANFQVAFEARMAALPQQPGPSHPDGRP